MKKQSIFYNNIFLAKYFAIYMINSKNKTYKILSKNIKLWLGIAMPFIQGLLVMFRKVNQFW